MKLSAKNRIYIWLAVWLAISGAVIGYFFKILQTSNQARVNEIGKQQKELFLLVAERDSYQQAKQDLSKLDQEPMQPDDFFSQDVTLVNEIRTLEALGQKLNVEMNLYGLSGTASNAPKAKTQGVIYAVPYGISLKGSFSDVVAFIETMENLDFVTTVSTVTLGSTDGGQVNASLTASFYLKQK